jgi:hypothetical protein
MSASGLLVGEIMRSQVLVPRIFTSVPSLMPAPTAPVCASKAPTQIAVPSLEAETLRPLGAETTGLRVGGVGLGIETITQIGELRVELGEEFLVRQAAPFGC